MCPQETLRLRICSNFRKVHRPSWIFYLLTMFFWRLLTAAYTLSLTVAREFECKELKYQYMVQESLISRYYTKIIQFHLLKFLNTFFPKLLFFMISHKLLNWFWWNLDHILYILPIFRWAKYVWYKYLYCFLKCREIFGKNYNCHFLKLPSCEFFKHSYNV